MSKGTEILRFLPNNAYQAAVLANAPSASNVYATMTDIPVVPPSINGIDIKNATTTIQTDSHSLKFTGNVNLATAGGANAEVTVNIPPATAAPVILNMTRCYAIGTSPGAGGTSEISFDIPTTAAFESVELTDAGSTQSVYPRLTFAAPADGNVLVKINIPIRFDQDFSLVHVGLHDSGGSGVTTTNPTHGWMTLAQFDTDTSLDEVQYQELDFLLTGLTPGNSIDCYMVMTSDSTSNVVQVGNQWGVAKPSSNSSVYPGALTMTAYSLDGVSIANNPSS